MILMIVSAIHSWFRGWSVPVFLLIIVGINYLTTFKPLNSRNHVYGINYDTTRVAFNKATLEEISCKNNITQDKKQSIEILEKWKEKNQNGIYI